MQETIKKIQLAIQESEIYEANIRADILANQDENPAKSIELIKELSESLKCRLGEAIGDNRISKKHIKEDLKLYEQDKFKMSTHLEEFLQFSQWTNSPFFGQGVEFGLANNEIILDLITEGAYPEFMRRFLVLGSTDIGDIGMWLYDTEVKDSEILLLNHDDESIHIVSHSLVNFVQRGLLAYEKDIKNDWFSPSSALNEIIHFIDGDEVYPIGNTAYHLDDIDNWPDHWKRVSKKRKLRGIGSVYSDGIPQVIATRVFEVNDMPAITVDFYKPQLREEEWVCEYRILGGIMHEAEFREQVGIDSVESLLKAMNETQLFLQAQQKQVGERITWQGSSELNFNKTFELN